MKFLVEIREILFVKIWNDSKRRKYSKILIIKLNKRSAIGSSGHWVCSLLCFFDTRMRVRSRWKWRYAMFCFPVVPKFYPNPSLELDTTLTKVSTSCFYSCRKIRKMSAIRLDLLLDAEQSRWRNTDKCQKNSSIWSCRSWQWQWYSCVRLVLIRCKINFVFTNFFLFLSISNRKYDLHSPKLKYLNCFRLKVKVISFVLHYCS